MKGIAPLVIENITARGLRFQDVTLVEQSGLPSFRNMGLIELLKSRGNNLCY